MQFPECLVKPNVDNTFFGIAISQTWQDLALWEEFLNRYPLKSILELGTWHGGMAAFLGMQARIRGASFTTVDMTDLLGKRSNQLAEFGIKVMNQDILSITGIEKVAHMLQLMEPPRMLFCDNGSKAQEYRTFVPLLENGDFVAVHDWGTEFFPGDRVPLMPFVMEAECESVTSMTRFFQVS